MKKTIVVSIVSLIFLFASSTVAYLLKYIVLTDWQSLGIGVGIAIVNAIIYFIIRKKQFSSYLGLSLNAISLGFLIRAWYIFRGFDNALWLMILVSIACISYLWLFYILLGNAFLNKHCGWFLLIFVILSLICYVFLIAFTTTTWVSTLGFYMIVEIAFIIGLSREANSFKNLVTTLFYCSFSIFIVAIIMAVIMLGGDGFDFDVSGIGSVDGGKIRSPRNKKHIREL